MADNQFTHHFIFKLGDGGKFIIAQFSFNKDGTISTLIKQTATPLPIGFFEDFVSMANKISELFVKYEGVKNISIVEKGVENTAISDITDAAKVK